MLRRKAGNILIYRSMEIASEFPRQIIALKPRGWICALLGNQGLQRLMIDEEQAREFPTFCKRLKVARDGDVYFQQQLLESGRAANEQMDRILASAPILPDAIKELRKTFTLDELKAIRLDEPLPLPSVRARRAGPRRSGAR